MTHNSRHKRMTIEALWADHLDVRELQRLRMFDENWVTYSNRFRWPKIIGLTVARYLVQLELYGHGLPQNIRVSWTRPHLGGERPWFHCPHCEKRVAKLYNGLGGYFCRACFGNPPYASQTKSAHDRRHFHACKVRLLLNSEARSSLPLPSRPRRMHRRTYARMLLRLQMLEAGLPSGTKKKRADYENLIAHVP